MIQYKFGNGYQIKQLDPNNWVMTMEKIKEKGDKAGENYEDVIGYYPHLGAAYRGAKKKLGNIVETHKELVEVLQELNRAIK